MPKELPKAYEPKNYEDAIYKRWEESGFFNPDVCVAKKVTAKNAKHFSIVLPPPNVTGTLHMGHAAMLAIEDIMVRYHRMKGDRTLWVPGTDHAAVATESKVENKLIKEEGFKKPKQELGREKFLERVRKFAQESHDTIVNQSKKMGASLDWSREAFTLDDKRNVAVRTVFKKMYDDGLIYRGYRVVNWSVKGQSTCSDDELVYVERPGKLYYFKYSKDFPITIATTRPETKLGDTAVAVNPKDARYKKYIGKIFTVDIGAEKPLAIKIITDDGVDMAVGTGALGVTPAHSAIDFEMYQKQKASGNEIGIIQVIGEDGRMTMQAGKDYVGLSVVEAREKFVSFLRTQGLLEKEDDTIQNVGTSDRFGDVVEPLPKVQWFIDVNKKFKLPHSEIKGIKSGQSVSLKQLMQQVVQKKQIKIIPDRFEKTYFSWIDNLHDWNISRQIWYGHQVPVWYCASCANPVVDAEVKEQWYLVRHGETDWNKEKKFTGRTDISLNEAGRNQAKSAAQKLSGVGVDYILTSGLSRARETAEIIAKATGAKVVVDERLHERDFGKAEGRQYDTVIAETPDFYGWFSKDQGSESYAEMEKRIWPIMEKFAVEHIGKKIVFVGHGGTGRIFLKRLKNISTDKFRSIALVKNAEPVKFDVLKPCLNCGHRFFAQDPDTLDTWFSSGLWTFSTLGWPEKTLDLKNFHPTSVLETGYDILFFWVARMILMTTYTLGVIPFETVYLHGLVRDEQGKKMSKSLGNVINPLDMIAKYGTDASRLSLVLGTTPGNDLKLSEEKIAGFRNFANKLWNIARFMLLTIERPKVDIKKPKAKTLADEWILSRLQETINVVTENFEKYNFSYAGEVLRDFTWSELADWYLEVAKIEGDKSAILNYILNTVLSLWHPFMPFVTETIWQEVYGEKTMLMVAPWPKLSSKKVVVKDFETIRALITGIRSWRSENKIEPAKLLVGTINPGKHAKLVKENIEIVKKLSRLEKLDIVKKIEKKAGEANFMANGMEIAIALGQAVDVEKEKIRLNTEIAQTEKYILSVNTKLNNQDFVGRAPAAVVDNEKKKLSEAQEKLEKMKQQLNNL
jgi:valyl-tRNA synthetase